MIVTVSRDSALAALLALDGRDLVEPRLVASAFGFGGQEDFIDGEIVSEVVR